MAKVIYLVLLEAGNEGSLMLSQDKFREELTDSYDVNKLYDVKLVCEHL